MGITIEAKFESQDSPSNANPSSASPTNLLLMPTSVELSPLSTPIYPHLPSSSSSPPSNIVSSQLNEEIDVTFGNDRIVIFHESNIQVATPRLSHRPTLRQARQNGAAVSLPREPLSINNTEYDWDLPNGQSNYNNYNSDSDDSNNNDDDQNTEYGPRLSLTTSAVGGENREYEHEDEHEGHESAEQMRQSSSLGDINYAQDWNRLLQPHPSHSRSPYQLSPPSIPSLTTTGPSQQQHHTLSRFLALSTPMIREVSLPSDLPQANEPVALQIRRVQSEYNLGLRQRLVQQQQQRLQREQRLLEHEHAAALLPPSPTAQNQTRMSQGPFSDPAPILRRHRTAPLPLAYLQNSHLLTPGSLAHHHPHTSIARSPEPRDAEDQMLTSVAIARSDDRDTRHPHHHYQQLHQRQNHQLTLSDGDRAYHESGGPSFPLSVPQSSSPDPGFTQDGVDLMSASDFVSPPRPARSVSWLSSPHHQAIPFMRRYFEHTTATLISSSASVGNIIEPQGSIDGFVNGLETRVGVNWADLDIQGPRRDEHTWRSRTAESDPLHADPLHADPDEEMVGR
ncbi:hypothetical protein BX616_004345 [Lobosporangium transversale]|uniref:Uncharacterized protein n=1 Tax=Lobosporangium transversale TaxID=64571 RepID=A0A1Y2GVT3_9FUNG|nr:hypothetical protein BCR41DRAFT_404674 [Lobosporangium transversale]KAF9916209.1 hypothetical protein BX616_004345 [Lobosporangium transversale]ORZ20169.1 hypothetical protein BCR41DRAFT_404674 [Lobosporangium transversale]|eukprot:XP_021882709.1 hypothetical protein BCR41DRAFT_404674 [Lobosporangium transversale]